MTITCSNLITCIQRMAAQLVKKSMFLSDGFDENMSQFVTVNITDPSFRVKQELCPSCSQTPHH